MAKAIRVQNAHPGKATICPVTTDGDLLRVRQVLRERSRAAGLDFAEETRLVTAGSDLARNIIRRSQRQSVDAKGPLAIGGSMVVEAYERENLHGLRAVFAAPGPGMSDRPGDDVAEGDLFAADDDSASAGDRGTLAVTRDLVDDFRIERRGQRGTTVTIVKWAR